MQRFPVFTESGMICSLPEILTILEQVKVSRQSDTMTTFLMPAPDTFFRASMRVTESKLEIIVIRELDELGDTDHEFALRLPQG